MILVDLLYIDPLFIFFSIIALWVWYRFSIVLNFPFTFGPLFSLLFHFCIWHSLHNDSFWVEYCFYFGF